MSLPATKNMTYYRGDTLEFSIRPLDSEGAAIDLSAYDATFTIATARGAAPSFSLVADAVIVANVINCTITPDDGATLSSGTSYVYDVEVGNPVGGPYTTVYTYVTGTMTVTDDVSNA